MRVSSDVVFDILLKYDRLRTSQLERATKEISSGKSLLAPSDNPVDFARKIRFNRFEKKLERFNRNIDLSKNVLETAETSLNSAINVLEEARVKIVQVLNTGTLNEEEAKVLSNYFRKVANFVISMGNTKVGDSFLFGGVKSQTQPFDSNGVYRGETVETTVPIADGVEVNSTFNGKNYFGVANSFSGTTITERDVIIVVAVLNEIANIIDFRDLTELNTDTVTVNMGSGSQRLKLLEAFDKGLSQMMAYRSIVGTQEKVVDDIRTQNESIALHLRELQSQIEDADYAEAIANFEKAKTAYEALLATVNQVQNISLLNYFVK